MKFKFKEREEPIYSSDPCYDLLWGGYVTPEKLLSDDEQIAKVREALSIVESFLGQAEESGSLEIC